MKFLGSLCLLIVCSVFSLNGEQFSYEGFRLVRIFPKSNEHANLIQQLETSDSEFDIWNMDRIFNQTSVDVLMSPIAYLKYKVLLESNNIRLEILDENIQNKIDEQKRSMLKSRNNPSILFRYVRYNEIINFIDETVNSNTDIASSYIAGQSHQKRDLKVIVLKPVATATRSLWIDCGIHAREWVSPATCVYIIDTLIKEFRANDPKTVAIFNKYEIHILPLVNPDGYEYSQTSFRLWRKNRRINSGSSCLGVDLNRNFGYKWMTGGSDKSPCSDIYAGPSQDSEPETQAIENSLKKKPGNWDVYLNLHSYGDWWLLPFGYTTTDKLKPADYNEQLTKGKIGVDAIKKTFGEQFEIGTSADLLYVNSGSSKDWAYGDQKIKYSYVLELRPGMLTSDAKYGFVLPEDRMTKVGPEMFAGIKALFYSIL